MNNIHLDLDNKCIKIDGVEYDLAKRGDYINYTSAIISEQVAKELNYIKAKIEKRLEKFESAPQPTSSSTEREYAILKCWNNHSISTVHNFMTKETTYKGSGIGCLEKELGKDKNCEIYSVKRLSDNTIWIVGDKIYNDEVIKDFFIHDTGTMMANWGRGAIGISLWEKKPTTVDDGFEKLSKSQNDIEIPKFNNLPPSGEQKEEEKTISYKELDEFMLSLNDSRAYAHFKEHFKPKHT